jgi:hypothetical protein
MRSSLFILLKLMLLLLPAAAAAQGFHLEVLDRVALPVASTGLNVGGFKSDSSGHVFFAPAARDTRGMLSSPNTIVRVSADKAVRFLLSDIPEARRASIEDFSPGTNGDLFVITTTHIGIGKMESYVVHFDSDGKYVSKNRIELAGFIPSQIAVFGSGDFLLAGWRLNFADSSDANRRPFTGVFNSRGQLLATLRLAGDIKKETAVDDFEEAISLSMAETGADGYVYFARAAANGPVFVISPSGRVVRTIPVSAPKGMKLVGMKPAPGWVVVVYEGKIPEGAKTPPVTMVVFDCVTGEKVAEYSHQSGEIGDALVDYTNRVFTFISTAKGGKLQFVRAGAQ